MEHHDVTIALRGVAIRLWSGRIVPLLDRRSVVHTGLEGSIVVVSTTGRRSVVNLILAILGENGSGKTTLMNMLAGIYFPDEGEILINGNPVTIKSPKDAFDNKIGMIHQHFKLVDVFSASENIVLGVESESRYNINEVNNEILDYAKENARSIGSSKHNTISRIVDRYSGAKNSMHRILHTMDVYKRSEDPLKFVNSTYDRFTKEYADEISYDCINNQKLFFIYFKLKIKLIYFYI